MTACPDCSTPLDRGVCWRCRASIAEARLQRLSVWGDDDWLLKLAQLTLAPVDSTKRLYPLGFAAELPISSPYVLTAQPLIAFTPELLVVAPECAYGTLTDLRVGNRSMFIDATPIPLSIFSPKSWASIEMMHATMGRMAFDMVSVGQTVAIHVDLTPLPKEPLVQEAWKHLGLPCPTHFRCALWGRSVDAADLATPPAPLSSARPTSDLRQLAIEAIQKTPQFNRIVNDLRRRLKNKG
jgi:hypothetical protein